MIISPATIAIGISFLAIAIGLILLARWDANRVIESIYRKDEIEFLKKIRDEYMSVKKTEKDSPT